MVNRDLITGIEPDQFRGDKVVDIVNRLEDTLAQIAFFGVGALGELGRGNGAVAQFHRLVYAGARAGWYRCAANDAGVELDVDFYCGIAARVDNFAGADVCDVGTHIINDLDWKYFW